MHQWESREIKCYSNDDIYTPRTGHMVLRNKDKIYLFGGTDTDRRQNDLYQFDLKTKRWNKLVPYGNLPSHRSGALGICDESNDKIYMFGGYNGRDGPYHNDIYCLDLIDLEWVKIQPLQNANNNINNNVENNTPKPRTDHSVDYYKDNLVTFGGFDGQNRFNDVHAFNLKTRQWREMGSLIKEEARPSKRFGHTSVVFDDKLWVFGGWDGKTTLKCCWIFDLLRETWISIENFRKEKKKSIKFITNCQLY